VLHNHGHPSAGCDDRGTSGSWNEEVDDGSCRTVMDVRGVYIHYCFRGYSYWAYGNTLS
jgi:hypothetical protein